MANVDQAHANNLLDGSMGTSPYVATVLPVRCRLMTANGSATVNGTELSTGGGYTSGTGAPSLTFAGAAGGTKNSNSAVTVTNMPAGTIVGIELWESTPLRKWWGALSASKTTNPGDTFSISSAALSLALA
jgi:hypothetical protein